MKFKDKLKKDKKFRVKVVIIAALILLFYGSFMAPDKKEWHGPDQVDCNIAANTASGADCQEEVLIAWITGGWLFPEKIRYDYLGDTCMPKRLVLSGPTPESKEACIAAECVMATKTNSFQGLAYSYDGWACFGCVPVGLRASSEDDCCSRDALFLEYGDKGYDFLCKDIDPENPPEDRICNSFEQGIADMMENVGIKLQCKTAYFLFIIGGAFMALILLAAMI